MVSGVLRALSICVPVALVAVPAATAETVAPATLAADIPAQPLAQALAEFARHTGLQLVYVSSVVRNKESHAVSAGLSTNEALTRLLEGTGLRFEYLAADTIDVLAAGPPEKSTQTPREGEPPQIIVTASRREENLQDVPITIQAITGDQLSELSALNFNDLVKYTTNITYSGNGPATNDIYIRGLGSASLGNQSQASAAPFPNVALYLDEQAMQFPSRNNDIYMVDLERIEVLEGPRGTLFGGGAQAGAIRYITNKPKLSATSGEFSAGYGVTAGGDPNSLANGVINIPLIADRLAVRAVIYSDHQGGYIDNVPGTVSFDIQPGLVFPGGYPPNTRWTSPVVSNTNLVRPNTNPLTYGGLRLSGLYQFNNDWDLLIQQAYQDLHADGYFFAYPADSNGKPLQPYQITAFNPAYTKDRYESTAWTVNGKFHGLTAIYAGSYMVRHIEGQQDYSNYANVGGGFPLYACIGPGAPYFDFPVSAGKPLQCYAPLANWHDSVRNEHQSHEIRISTNEVQRVRGLVGAYWEKFVIDDNMNWNYLDIPQCDPANLAKAQAGGPDCLSAVGPVPGSWASDPSLRENMNNAFGDDVQRGYRQYAFFASVDFDLVPKLLTATVGTRYYHYDEFEEGSLWFTGTLNPLIVDHPNGTCTAAQACGYPISVAKSESGLRSRASLAWHISPDVMTYYTFSQGFRPGGFNRIGTGVIPAALPYCGLAATPGCAGAPAGTEQFIAPVGFQSDTLINNELGLKSELLNHRVLVNASAYRMKWNDVQLPMYNATNELHSNVNGPSYLIKGVELQLTARVTDGLTVQGSGSWNSSNQTNAPCLRSAGVTPATPNNPTPAGQCITVVYGLPYTSPFDTLNSSLPFSPSLLVNLRARYDWAAGAYKPFAWVGASHFGSMHTEPATFPDGLSPAENPPAHSWDQYTIPAYTTYDAAVGVSKDNWTAQLTGSNLSNSDAVTNVSSSLFIKATIPLRPRVLMARFSYRF